MSLYTLALWLISCCVYMCLVIRFPLLFGNVRACTNECLVSREDRLQRMPLASPWFSPLLVISGYDRRPGRRNKPSFLTWLIFLSCLILRLDRGFWNCCCSPCSSWVQFGGCDRRPGRKNETTDHAFSGGKLVFSHAMFLMSINILSSHSLNLVLWLLEP